MKKKILVISVISLVAGAGIFCAFSSVSAENRSVTDKKGFFEEIYEGLIKPFLSKPAEVIDSVKEKVEAKKEELKTAEPAKELYAPTVDYEEAVVKAVEKASPSVVSIVISKDLPIIEQCPTANPFSDLPPEFQNFFGGQQFYAPCQKGTKREQVGGGSGFIISSDGLVVTNKHVASDPKALYAVLTNDGKKYDAKIISIDPVRDFAVIKISGNNFPVVKLGNSDSIKLGQTAIAIGNALGEFRNTVSAGVVSGLARDITASDGRASEKIEGVIQTDAAINPGNSGGPLLNLKGEVIGINVATVQGAQSIGFAIPVNQIKNAVESVKNYGRIISPYLGVRYVLVSEELKEKEKLSVSEGALVCGGNDGPGVIPNSPADKAGVLAEDIIVSINGDKITASQSLSALIQKYRVGKEVVLKIVRKGEEKTLKAILEERPAE